MRQLPNPMYLSQHSKRRLVFCFTLALLLVLALVYGAFWWFPKHMPKWWPRWLGGKVSKNAYASSYSSSSYVSIEPKKKPVKKKHAKRGEHGAVGFEGLDDLGSVRRKSMKSVEKLQDALNGQAASRPTRRRAKKSTLVSFLDSSSTVSTNSASEERRFPKKYKNSKIFCGRRMDQWVYQLHDKVKELVLQYGRNIGREYFENIETFWRDVRPKRELLLSKKQKRIVAKQIEAGAKELVKSMAEEKQPSKRAKSLPQSPDSRKIVKSLKRRKQSGKRVKILPQSSESSNEESAEFNFRKTVKSLKRRNGRKEKRRNGREEKRKSIKNTIILSQSSESSNEESTEANSRKVTTFMKKKNLSNKRATTSESSESTESTESTESSESTKSTESTESTESPESSESLKGSKLSKQRATIASQSPKSRGTVKSLKGKKRSRKQATIVSKPLKKRKPSNKRTTILPQSSESIPISDKSQSLKKPVPTNAIEAKKVAPTSNKDASRSRKKTAKLPPLNLSEGESVSGDWKESLEISATKISPPIQPVPSSPRGQRNQTEAKALIQDTTVLATKNLSRKKTVKSMTKHPSRKETTKLDTKLSPRKETALGQDAIRTANPKPTTIKTNSTLPDYDSSDDTVVKPTVIPTRRTRTARRAPTPASSNTANNQLFGGKYNLIDMS